jgi:hypothetical protein
VSDDEPVGDPGDALRRLVCFVAASLDVPYAYIAAHTPPRDEREASGVTVWLARDYGLQFEFAELYGVRGGAPGAGGHLEALHRLWPGLASLLGVCARGVPLHDDRGVLLGHLAVLSPAPSRREGDAARLEPLARAAAAKLQRWLGTRP